MINVRIEDDVNTLAEQILARTSGWPKKSKHALVNETLREQFKRRLAPSHPRSKKTRSVA